MDHHRTAFLVRVGPIEATNPESKMSWPLILIMLVLASLVALIAWLSPLPETSSDYASWAQAVGGIATVLAAVMIAGDQARRSRLDEERRRRERFNLAGRQAYLAAGEGERVFGEMVAWSASENWTAAAITTFRSHIVALQGMLEGLALADLKTLADARALVELRVATATAQGFLEAIDHATSKGGSGRLPGHFDATLSDFSRIKQHFETRYGQS
jgi:hypothetical protein